MQVGERKVLERPELQGLLDALSNRGYRVVGPTVRDGAIVYDQVAQISDLPCGWTDQQDGGTYRLVKRGDEALFGYTVGPDSWKKFLHPPLLRLWRAEREEDEQGFQIKSEPLEEMKYAFIGVRPCELHAMAIQDRILMNGEYADPAYEARREGLFIVAVNCGQAGGTCFCASMDTGPKATFGFDLALTEVLEEKGHYFVVEVGTDRGAEVLGELSSREATEQEQETAEKLVAETAEQMGRTMDTTEIKELLYRNYEHPRWEEVGSRCLSCGNCTMVCPTCFCTTVEDSTDLSGKHAERWRRWDSCFTVDFSYIHGGSVRTSSKARYRQWLTHKLAAWMDQYARLGCVGCGRCITWCPVGIDLTEEVRAIRASDGAGGAKEKKYGTVGKTSG